MASETLILDGAMATELEKLGADLDDPLWSCKTLIEQPKLIQSVHVSYFNAGADIAITASYQATAKGLSEQKGFTVEESKALVRKSVALAQSARDEFLSTCKDKDKALFIAGSVGPYGAYLADGNEYRGDYRLPKDEMKRFHRPRIEALVEAGVDILALETMPNREEVEALVELLNEEFSETQVWISCSMKDGRSISDGTPIENVYVLAKKCHSLRAFGVNCCPPELVVAALKALAEVMSPSHSLICYPNSGETWEASNNSWNGANAIEGGGWIRLVENWTAASGDHNLILGGCCRTGPKDISIIKTIVVDSQTKK